MKGISKVRYKLAASLAFLVNGADTSESSSLCYSSLILQYCFASLKEFRELWTL